MRKLKKVLDLDKTLKPQKPHAIIIKIIEIILKGGPYEKIQDATTLIAYLFCRAVFCFY